MSATSLWLMGMHGAGKSTCALRVAMHNRKSVILDADNLRRTMNADLGWDDAGRIENARRIACIAAYLVDQRLFPIVCCQTPLKAMRDVVRAILPHTRIAFLYAELEDLKNRMRGESLYKRVEAGEALALAGVNYPFEYPGEEERDVLTVPNISGRQGDAYLRIFDLIEAHQP